MSKKLASLILVLALLAPYALAENSAADTEYLNKLHYKHNKLELVTKKRLIDEKRHYSYTDINSDTFSWEAYSNTRTSISTSGYSRSEVKEINEWYIYLGGISELTDFEFLKLIGEDRELARISGLERQREQWRCWGNVILGTGLAVMLGGAAASASSSVVTSGALGMTAGIIISNINSSPPHYISAAYAQSKIDEYNVKLKQGLNLPLTYE